MMMTPEPFLGAEIRYRQQRVADDFDRYARRHRVRRRPHLRLPGRRRRTVAVA